MQNGHETRPTPPDINASSVLLALRIGRPGNRRRVNPSLIEVDADKDALSVGKELLDSRELKAVATFDGGVRQWLYGRSLPAYGVLKAGVYRLPMTLIEEVDARLAEVVVERDALIDAFMATYPDTPERLDRVRARLRALFNPDDYPAPDEVRGAFTFDYRYLELGIPGSLSAPLLAREREKAAARLTREVDQIKLALRASFAELVSHAAERLQVQPDGKKNVFRDSLIRNMEEFCRYFGDRNIVHDQELAALVEQAQRVIRGVDADGLRNNDGLRAEVGRTMGQIKATMDKNLMLEPSRRLLMDK